MPPTRRTRPHPPTRARLVRQVEPGTVVFALQTLTTVAIPSLWTMRDGASFGAT